MPHPYSPEVLRLRAILQDGPVEEALAAATLASGMHPGKAYRSGIEIRERHHPKPYVGKRDEMIRIGARRMALLVIRRSILGGRVERVVEDGVKYLKLTAKPWIDFKPYKERKYASNAHRPAYTAWGQVIRSMVDEGPVPLTHLVDEAAKVVPDEHVERYLRSVATKRTPDGARRQIVRSTITNLEKNGRLDITDIDGQRVVAKGKNPWVTD